MFILCEVFFFFVMVDNLITCCICVRYVNISLFKCINIMDVNYICLHGTWHEVRLSRMFYVVCIIQVT